MNYTAKEKEDFISYLNKITEPQKGEAEMLKGILIKMYSYPVQNKLSLKK